LVIEVLFHNKELSTFPKQVHAAMRETLPDSFSATAATAAEADCLRFF
jgi:hypothetical protein